MKGLNESARKILADKKPEGFLRSTYLIYKSAGEYPRAFPDDRFGNLNGFKDRWVQQNPEKPIYRLF
ncbi:hypothetical protein [Leadbettera azotonutricia]|uniref:Uncharacterized protein n=1 Tax=Leadbettera azotonutricia (strain ATCC BAA-888 / DSM 13862 / ZAS-9) TaxID=545695 RepID=F5YEC2_LEAAZ|nr:hypothetical protein [Leadbettera azotonutricia]AEF83307.1 hypothetical protein TREAZ_2648 [Leadbettera azotonutricia ZAS-9]